MLLIFFKLKKKKVYFVYVLRQLKTNREKTSYSFNESESKNKKTATTTKKRHCLVVKKTVIKKNDFMVIFVV